MGFVYVARFPSAPLIDSRPPLINALALSRLSVSAPAGRIPAGNALLATLVRMLQNSERTQNETQFYEVRPRKDRRGVDLISGALLFGRLWYEDASAAVDYAKRSSRSHDAVIRVYDEPGNEVETHEHVGDLKEP